MHTRKLNKFWHQSSSFITTLQAGANCKFMRFVDIQISCGCKPGYYARKGSHTGTVKIDLHKFCHSQLPWNSHIFKILCGKKEKLEIAVLLFWSKKTVSTIKWHLSENLTFQNLSKNRKLLPAEKFGSILAFDKDSKRKLLSLRSISTKSFIKKIC